MDDRTTAGIGASLGNRWFGPLFKRHPTTAITQEEMASFHGSMFSIIEVDGEVLVMMKPFSGAPANSRGIRIKRAESYVEKGAEAELLAGTA